MVRHYTPSEADRRRAACAWLAFAACGALDLWLRGPATTRAEFGGGTGAVLTGILAGIGALFGKSKTDFSTKRILQGLMNAVAAVGTSFTGYAYETNGKLGGVAGVLIRFWDGILSPFLHKTDTRIRKIYDWLKDTFGPIVKALLWLRKHVLDVYTKYFRPILDTIDAIRGMLRILGLLHIKVAQELDAKLARLEAKLLKPLRVALETINLLIDWTQRIIDRDGFFQRYTLLRSLILHERDVWSVWSASVHHREKEHAASPSPWPKPTTVDDKVNESVSYLVNGDGPSKARIDEAVQDTMLNITRGSLAGF